MITSLTPEQKARKQEFRDKWININLSTAPVDFEQAKKDVIEVYKVAGFKPPVNFYFYPSPFKAVEEITKMTGKSKKDVVSNMVYGFQDALWLSFYDYFLQVCNLEYCRKLEPLMRLAENCGWWSPYDDTVFFQDRPAEIHLKDKRFHNPNGMAVLYRDGTGIYSLNGVTVPKEIVMTDADKLDPMLITTYTNVEVRREFVRKIGAERLVQKLGGTVENKEGDYELLSLDLGLPERSKALKMKNPSIGVYHIEWVSKDCHTVQDAINFRKSNLRHHTGDWKPSIIT